MPIYGYSCKSCEHSLDALQKMSDDPLVECPACGELALKRLLSAPRFRLKGQGWYETDFKRDNQRNLAGDKDSSSSTDKPSDKSTKKADDKSSSTTSESSSKAKASTSTS